MFLLKRIFNFFCFPDCFVLKSGDWIRISCQGFKLKTDAHTTATISIENDELQSTFVTGELRGMCGNSNGDPSGRSLAQLSIAS